MKSLEKPTQLPWVVLKKVHLQRPLELARFAIRRHAELCVKLMRGEASSEAQRRQYVLEFDSKPGGRSSDEPQVFYQAVGTQGASKGRLLGYNFYQTANGRYYGVLSNCLSHGSPRKCAYEKLPQKIGGFLVEWSYQENVHP